MWEDIILFWPINECYFLDFQFWVLFLASYVLIEKQNFNLKETIKVMIVSMVFGFWFLVFGFWFLEFGF